jgi:hypothetical protein
MKNDITYEYRVFTNRLIDIENMEVGKCTSKVIKEIKPKDKVDGRFFHTSDTDEWFFCWKGELQKLNLKGNADVSAALDEAKKATEAAQNATTAANTAVSKADAAATVANSAATNANKAVETIDNKIAEKANASDVTALTSDVNILKTSVEDKANKSDVDLLSETVKKIDLTTKADRTELDNYAKIGHTHDYATVDHNHDDLYAKSEDVLKQDDLAGYAKTEDLEGYALKSDLTGLATEKYVDDKIKQIEFPEGVDFTELEEKIAEKQDIITDLQIIRDGAAAGATALQSDALNGYATEEYVSVEISKIQNSSYDDTEIRNELNKKANQSELFSKSYNDLTDKPELFSKSYNDLTDTPELFSGSYNDLTDTPELFSGSYNDLTDKPTIPSIEGLATESYADSLVKDSEGKSLFDAAGAAEIAAAAAETAAKTYTDSKLASIEEELERITNKILGV